VWGDGSAKRDILFIDDLVDMIEKIIDNQHTPYELFNCGAGKAYSIKELANAIMEVNQKELVLEYDTSKPNIPTVVILDCEKAHNMLGWYPLTSIEDGMRKTSEWYKEMYLNK
jgi:nucleoside-diphosphate-sugar epimerase